MATFFIEFGHNFKEIHDFLCLVGFPYGFLEFSLGGPGRSQYQRFIFYANFKFGPVVKS
jgi:hypothetical protein